MTSILLLARKRGPCILDVSNVGVAEADATLAYYNFGPNVEARLKLCGPQRIEQLNTCRRSDLRSSQVGLFFVISRPQNIKFELKSLRAFRQALYDCWVLVCGILVAFKTHVNELN